MWNNLLDELQSVRWQTAFRTFGNDHSTLIGLLVDWWISLEPTSRWALEGGPSFGYRPRNVRGGGQCDAILGEREASVGVVEVEGFRYEHTIEKIGKFFEAEYADLATLQFAVLLAYRTGPQGRGPARSIPALPLDEFVDIGRAVTRRHPTKTLAILALDKRWETIGSGPRARTEYYGGRPIRVSGALVQRGQEVGRRLLAEDGH